MTIHSCFKALVPIGVSVLLLFTSVGANSADLESLARESSKSKTASIESFSEQEIISKIRNGDFSKSGDLCNVNGRYSDDKYYSSSEKDRCQSMLKSFDKTSFGECKYFYLSGSGPGNRLLESILNRNYSTSLSKEARQDAMMKGINFAFEQANKRVAGKDDPYGCTQEHLGKLKDLSNKIYEAANIATEEHDKVSKSNLAAEALKKQESERKKKSTEVCQTQVDYKIHVLSYNIIKLQDRIENGELILKNEKARGAVSGYVNKETMYESGKLVSDSRKLLDLSFRQYKDIGGKASKIEDVKQLPDPCS